MRPSDVNARAAPSVPRLAAAAPPSAHHRETISLQARGVNDRRAETQGRLTTWLVAPVAGDLKEPEQRAWDVLKRARVNPIDATVKAGVSRDYFRRMMNKLGLKW